MAISRTLLTLICAGVLFGCDAPTSTPQDQSSNETDQNPLELKENSVRYEFYRNAAAELTYNHVVFLLDPMLSNKGALPSFANIAPNPLVDLPKPKDEIVAGIDAVIVGHMHRDHFDEAAAMMLPKEIPIFTPDNEAPVIPTDPKNPVQTFKEQLARFGFTNVTTIEDGERTQATFAGVTLKQEFAQHGRGILPKFLGGVNGIIFEAADAPTIYWTGDSILDAEGRVEEILTRYQPDIVIAHTGGAVIDTLSPDPLMMDTGQAIRFFEAARAANPDVRIIAVHMNALDHCFTTREELREALDMRNDGLGTIVDIPREGDVLRF
ncbi:MAG: MBL fold metallo-hydrolase [Pseudomonadota bacterium]